MKRILTFITLAILCSMLSPGEKLAVLQGVFKPSSLTIDPYIPQFYVTEGASIHIYSLDDFSLKATFGKAGEGPQEFRVIQSGEGIIVLPLKESLLINSMRRLSFFSKDGKFTRELSTGAGFMSMRFQPIDQGYVGLGISLGDEKQSMSFTMNLYDDKFNITKQIQKINLAQRGRLQFPMVAPIFHVMDDKIITLASEDFIIDIFDMNGTKVSTIARDYKKVKVTEDYKRGVHDIYKRSPVYKQYYEMIKNMMQFSEYFPAIQNLFAADKKIYIHTYMKEDGKYEFFIYSLKGEFIKRLYLPVVYQDSLKPSPYSIMHSKLYQLIENENEEVWEIHAAKIE